MSSVASRGWLADEPELASDVQMQPQSSQLRCEMCRKTPKDAKGGFQEPQDTQSSKNLLLCRIHPTQVTDLDRLSSIVYPCFKNRALHVNLEYSVISLAAARESMSNSL